MGMKLDTFLSAWKSYDLNTMHRYASDTTVRDFFGGDGRPYEYRLVWSEHCGIGPLGVGNCEVLVTVAEDRPSLIYRFDYAAASDVITIDRIIAAGDAG
jgi:hypothetical protein